MSWEIAMMKHPDGREVERPAARSSYERFCQALKERRAEEPTGRLPRWSERDGWEDGWMSGQDRLHVCQLQQIRAQLEQLDFEERAALEAQARRQYEQRLEQLRRRNASTPRAF